MTDVTCCEKCCKPLDDHPLIDVSNVKVLQMCDRHPKWKKVQPGTVIPAGQPYRVEFNDGRANERVAQSEWSVGNYEISDVFIDSSWKPPLDSAWDRLSEAVDQFDNNLSISGTPNEALRLRDCVRGLLNLHEREAAR